MAKDPAFLVYTKDMLEGTADMEPAEMGAYCRLLFHQHQRGALPIDTRKLCRLAGFLDMQEFESIWEQTLSHKFCKTENGYVNAKAKEVMDDRNKSAREKTIRSEFANFIKRIKKTLTAQQMAEFKEKIKYDELYEILAASPKSDLKDDLTVHLNKLLSDTLKEYQLGHPCINGDGDAIANAIGIEKGNEAGDAEPGRSGGVFVPDEIRAVFDEINSIPIPTGDHGEYAFGTFDPEIKEYWPEILARISESSLEEALQVVQYQAAQWIGSEKMEPFLNPQTLFTKVNYSKYLENARRNRKKGISPKQITENRFDKGDIKQKSQLDILADRLGV